MSITGKEVEAGIQIMNLVFKTKRLGPNVHDVMNHASVVAGLLTNTNKDQQALSNAIVTRMVTIRAEVK